MHTTIRVPSLFPFFFSILPSYLPVYYYLSIASSLFFVCFSTNMYSLINFLINVCSPSSLPSLFYSSNSPTPPPPPPPPSSSSSSSLSSFPKGSEGRTARSSSTCYTRHNSSSSLRLTGSNLFLTPNKVIDSASDTPTTGFTTAMGNARITALILPLGPLRSIS